MKKDLSKNLANSENPQHRALYFRVGKHWLNELVNANISGEWLENQAGSSPAIVRKLIQEIKRKSAVCLDLLRIRLSDLKLKIIEDQEPSQIDSILSPYGSMSVLEKLYTSNAMLIGRSEELIVQIRDVQDGRTTSLLTRMRNIQLERHQLYSRFFQPDHMAFRIEKHRADRRRQDN